jgi:glycyl-tRNA synthetase beta chain
MDLPPELLTTVMRHHQKYFALTDARGRLAPRFIVVLNTETRDKGKAAVAGNERVLRARLADAKFFWDQDRKRRLDSRVDDLGGRVFHAKLGTVWDKVHRLNGRVQSITPFIPGLDAEHAKRAAHLCKADLSTGMVGEFPELQGVMGRYYALHDGEPKDVADAVAEHYSPLGPNDACPMQPVSIAVALADKLDTLAGFWAIDEKPTGSRDPFALRRAALGVIRIILENKLRIPLKQQFQEALLSHGAASDQKTAVPADLMVFIAERLKVHLREAGVRYDLIDAVFALGGEDDLTRLMARVDALDKFLRTNNGANLLIAYKRAANIVRIEEKKDGRRYDGRYDLDRLSQDEERTLAAFLAAATEGAREALAREDFTTAMAAISRLRRPVDSFFENVTVNCDDPALRENRLKLLGGIGSTLDQVADFSKLEGGDR